MSEVIQAEVKWVIYKNGSFHVLDLGRGIKATGNIMIGEDFDVKGINFKFVGNWHNSKYGKVFRFDSSQMLTDEMFFFLTRIVKGIGESMALELIEKFGSDEIEEILNNNPYKLKQMPGIGTKRLNTIIESWRKNSNLRKLSSFMGNNGLTPEAIRTIYNIYGDDSVDVIKNNPYIIIDISNMPFYKIDSFALNLGIEKDSNMRIIAIAHYILEKIAQEGGNTLVDINFFVKKHFKLSKVQYSEDYKENVVEKLNNSESFVVEENFIALRKYKYFEEKIIEFLELKRDDKNLNLTDDSILSFIKDYEKREGFKLSDLQIKTVKEAVNSKIYAVTGYAGTGKTTVTRVILELLETYNAGKIVGTAFSGVAARRLSSVTGFPCYTIHSLLGYNGKEFTYDKFNKLEADVVLLDEAGMVNSELFYCLIRALDDKTTFILCGDDAQLPPIGPGNVFSDVINYNISSFEKLEEVFRQDRDSVINIFAGQIRKGIIPEEFCSTHADWYFAEAKDKEYCEDVNQDILEKIIKISSKYINEGIENILEDIQILSPMKKGTAGTYNLNFELKNLFNPASNYSKKENFNKKKITFSPGDKIVNLKNKDKTVWNIKDFNIDKPSEDNSSTERIFNGTLGIIKKICHKSEKIYVQTNTELVIEYDFSEVSQIFEHAFSLTVHKSQGSEFGVVIIPLTPSHKFMLNNQLLYTAVTRAKKGVILVGKRSCFTYAVKNSSGKVRNTWIKKLSS
ncbi:MAG: SF1B family DNA helicase RecD2 [Candidatus Muiribacteriota bacterium]